jgi:hypothetical protein
VQGHTGDGHAPGAADKVEEIPAGGLGLVAKELGDGAGEAWQELAVGAAGKAMMSGLDDLLGSEALLGGGGGAAEVEQACDLGDLEAGVGVEEEVAEQTSGEVVAAALLEKLEGGFEYSLLGDAERGLGNSAVVQPLGKGEIAGRHGNPSGAAGDRGRIWRRSWNVTQKARKTVWC